MNKKYNKWLVAVLVALYILLHFAIDSCIDAQSGWTVYPPLSAMPDDFSFEDGMNYSLIRILAQLQGVLLITAVYLSIKFWRK